MIAISCPVIELDNTTHSEHAKRGEMRGLEAAALECIFCFENSGSCVGTLALLKPSQSTTHALKRYVSTMIISISAKSSISSKKQRR